MAKKKLKIFVSHKYADEDIKEFGKKLDIVCNVIRILDYEPICLFSKEEDFINNKLTLKELFQKSFDEIDRSDVVLVFVDSPHLSTGMFTEVGYGIAKGKRTILLIKKNIESHLLRGIIEEAIEFEDIDRLRENLSKIKITGNK